MKQETTHSTYQIFRFHFPRVFAARHNSPGARRSARQLVAAMKAARERERE